MPAVTSVLLFCPLNRLCLVWVCLPIVQNPCQTEADPFCPLRAAAFPATMLISSLLTLRACTQRFPLKFSLFFLSFLVFSLYFRSNLFSFPLTLLFLLRCEKSPVFRSLYRARQRPLYSACRDQCFTVLPLNRLCLVWVCLPIVQNPCQTEADPFCPFCAPRTHFVSACHGLSCHNVNFLSPHTQSMH